MKVKLAVILLISLLFAQQVISGEIVPLIVLSGSMVPYMYPGDIILVKKVDPKQISVGDVICFKDPSGREKVLITHRVVNISSVNGELIFKTKGDALEEEDNFNVTENDIVGVPVILIPMLGYLHENKKLVYFFMILLPSALIFVSEFRVIINPKLSERLEEKNKRKLLALSRRKVVSWKRVTLTLITSYTLFSLLLFQEFVPIQRIVIESGKVSIPQSMDPYRVYYFIPPFYVELLYRINPILPDLAIVLYPLFVSLLLSPLWKTGGRKRKWIKKRRLRFF